MDNGTLMLNGIDYSNGKGTLVVNGVIYSGGSGGEIKTIDYYLVQTKSAGQSDASVNIIHKQWNKTDKTTTVIATETLRYQDASTGINYFDVLNVKYENLNWHIKNIVKTTEYDINTEFGTWAYNEVNSAVTTIISGAGGSGSGGGAELKTLATNLKIVEGGEGTTKTFDITGLGITDVSQVYIELVSVKTTTGGNAYSVSCVKTINNNTLTLVTGELTGTSEIVVNVLYLVGSGGSGETGCQVYNKFYSPVEGDTTDTFSAELDGVLRANACGYVDGFPTLKINDIAVQPTNSFYVTSHYAYGEYFEINVNKDDNITFVGSGSGTSYYSLLCVISKE